MSQRGALGTHLVRLFALAAGLFAAVAIGAGCGSDDDADSVTGPEDLTVPTVPSNEGELVGQCLTALAASEDVGEVVDCSDPAAQAELAHGDKPSSCPAIAVSAKSIDDVDYCVAPLDPKEDLPPLVGRCTNGAPFANDAGVLVDCSGKFAKSRIVASAPAGNPGPTCAELVGPEIPADEVGKGYYCVEPVEDDAKPPEPKGDFAIGSCTDFDISEKAPGPVLLPPSTPVAVVDCDSKRARSEIVSFSNKSGGDCKFASLQVNVVNYYCLGPLEG